MEIQQGIIDVHAHIIPGVDDGSRTMGETVRLLKLAAKQGITAVIATPHYSRRSVLRGIPEWAAWIQEEMQKSCPGFRVFPGQETFYHRELPDRLHAGEATTLAGGRYVLVEFDPLVPYQELYQGIRSILTGGYLPVLAHIERYACLRKEGTQELLSCGCKLQMNYGSLQGNLFSHEVHWCRKQIKQETVHFLGTDMHRINYRPPQITEAVKWLENHVSPDYAARITRENALRMINNESIR